MGVLGDLGDVLWAQQAKRKVLLESGSRNYQGVLSALIVNNKPLNGSYEGGCA